MKTMVASVAIHISNTFDNAASKVLTKKTLEGEKRSATENIAKKRVPVINPTCTAAVIWLMA